MEYYFYKPELTHVFIIILLKGFYLLKKKKEWICTLKNIWLQYVILKNYFVENIICTNR